MTIRTRTSMSAALLSLLAALLLASPAASAKPLVGKDGKIHACYKWKGKKKGTMRVVRSAKVRCPKRWKKVSWYASPVAALPGTPGPAGTPGPQGEKGLPGTAGNVAVEDLEAKVSELLTKVEQLEAALPTVQTLCTQMETLTSQVNAIEDVLGGLSLNPVLTALGGVLNIPTLPGELPAFNCPS